jgi:hypothetical protein
MTEQEWLEGRNLRAMLQSVQGKASERQLRLFLVACCERIEHLLVDARSRSALACARRAADGRADEAELEREHHDAHAAWGAAVRAVGIQQFGAAGFERMCRTLSSGLGIADRVAASDPVTLAAQAVESASESRATLWDHADCGARAAARAISLPAAGDERAQLEVGAVCGLFRDIFGNPFRPVVFDSAWRTDTAIALARTMYESREFSAMPILADALQDAGCDNPDMLNHCRDASATHVRGCWVVDLVLGKE